jgi:hypothetical protein
MAVNWDKSGMRITPVNLAKAAAVEGRVRLDFGASIDREQGDLRDVRLLQRILLEPEAASSLAKLLNTLISKQKTT